MVPERSGLGEISLSGLHTVSHLLTMSPVGFSSVSDCGERANTFVSLIRTLNLSDPSPHYDLT